LSRRVSLPAADDLFRPTAGSAKAPEPSREQAPRPTPPAEAQPEPEPGAAPERRAKAPRPSEPAGRKPSGRVRHDEKMTVYVTSDELLDLEHARLLLRRNHGLAVDRGRFVREAVALALADLDARGEGSEIVQRLKQA
jgi:hypothetical protein